VIVSPDELNHHLHTLIIAPLTTGGRPYPWRVACEFKGRSGSVALDQIRTVDAERLVKVLGKLQPSTFEAVLKALHEMFTL